MKAFPIEFVAQTIRQTLLEEHLKSPSKYCGGDDQVAIHSFYEQLQGGADVDRFVESYSDLINQQNRASLILNGVILSQENPTITNIKDKLIIPMSWVCSFRCTLKDRDLALETLNHLTELLKGRKVDIAEMQSGKVFKVGTIGQYREFSSLSSCRIDEGNYIGSINTNSNATVNTQVMALLNNYQHTTNVLPKYVYVIDNADYKLKTIYNDNGTYKIVVDDGTYRGENIVFCPQETFTPYKLSLSFDALRCDTPITLNGDEYINISLSGMATLVSKSVKLGNDLLRVAIKKSKITAATDITLTDTYKYLDPLEMPNSNSANTQVNQLIQNGFLTNTHTDSIAPTIQYSFVLDEDISFLEQLYNYSRYGTQGITASDISPNMVFNVKEIYSSWGSVVIKEYNAKIIESIDVENTESDVVNLSVTFQIQGANN